MNNYAMSYDDFLEHVEATGGELTRDGDVSTLIGDYCGRECLIGRFYHDSDTADLCV